MNIIFKFMFERLTDPLGLPINPLYEYAILGVIGLIAYAIAYSKVGDMYHEGWISGKTSGSAWHWFIRLICFFAIWFVAYVGIQIYFLVKSNLQLVLMIVGGIVGTAIICVLAVSVMRFIKKHRTVKGNA